MGNRYSGKLRLRTHLWVMAFMTVICGVSIFTVYKTLIEHNIEEIQRAGNSMARFVLETVKEPLRTRSYYALQEISMGIRNMPNLVYFDVTDEYGRSFLADRGTIRGQAFEEFDELKIDKNTFIIEKEVSFNGEYLGSMIMAISAQGYRDRTEQVFIEIATAIALGLAVVGLLASALMERFFLIPMDQLSDAAESIGDEKFVTLGLGERKDEIGQLAQSFNRMSRTLESRVKERTKELSNANIRLKKEIERRILLERKLKKAASMDPLTSLLNRQAFEMELRSMDNSGPLCLILFDLDHFKLINDSYGHLAGDKVLKEVARLSSRHLKGLKAKICRWGGEEFLIALKEPLETAGAVAEELRRLIEESQDMPMPVTASFGVIETKPEEQREEAFDRADRCLYRAKERGRNNVCCAPKV